MKTYKTACIGTSLLFLYLFFQLLLNSATFVDGLGIQSSVATSVLCRRTSMFMLGISVLLFCARRLPHSPARQFICLSTGITMIGLACTGINELIGGTVNTSILQAIAIEITCGTLFGVVFFRSVKTTAVKL